MDGASKGRKPFRVKPLLAFGGETDTGNKGVEQMTEQTDQTRDEQSLRADGQHEDKALIRAQGRLKRLEDEREEIAGTLGDLGAQLREIHADLRSGKVSSSAEDRKLLADIRYWLRAARDTESEIEELRRREAGIVGEYGLDLEQACAQVRCRLDSLRACCGADTVPR